MIDDSKAAAGSVQGRLWSIGKLEALVGLGRNPQLPGAPPPARIFWRKPSRRAKCNNLRQNSSVAALPSRWQVIAQKLVSCAYSTGSGLGDAPDRCLVGRATKKRG